MHAGARAHMHAYTRSVHTLYLFMSIMLDLIHILQMEGQRWM